MNLLSFLITTGINILYSPFADERNPRSVVSGAKEINQDSSYFPFNILKRTPACTTVTFTLGENQMKLSTMPRGYCSNCCQVNIHRDVQFIYYNKTNEGVLIEPYDEAGAARNSGVNPDWPTTIFIHGFSEMSPGESSRTILKAYLSLPTNYNIILVDWGELAPFPWYRTAVHNVKLLGEILKNFIVLFHQSGEIPIENLHVIGFSLGSHIASMAGKALPENLRIPRITALDPAFPEFPLKDRAKRLANTDADYIDVIHTDSGILGFPTSLGHADFYPNGGQALQPGCQPSYLAQQQIIDQVFACSHVRAWKLYAESVRNPLAFPSTQCQSWRGPNKTCDFNTDAYMGFGIDKNVTGKFYLRTSFKSPFGLPEENQL